MGEEARREVALSMTQTKIVHNRNSLCAVCASSSPSSVVAAPYSFCPFFFFFEFYFVIFILLYFLKRQLLPLSPRKRRKFTVSSRVPVKRCVFTNAYHRTVLYMQRVFIQRFVDLIFA